MTAGNRWPVSNPSALPGSSSDNHDQGSENNHHRTGPAVRGDPLSGAAVESVVDGTTTTTSFQRPHLPPPPTPTSTAATLNRSSQDPRDLAPLGNHHLTNTFPYSLFPERQLPAFDLRQVNDVNRGPLPPIASQTRLGAGVSTTSDPRSPFGMEDPSSSSSTIPSYRNPSVTVDKFGQRDHPPSHALYQPPPQVYSHSRPSHSIHPAYQTTPGYSHDTFHPENILSRPSSSHEGNHLGISSLLQGGYNRDRERSGLAVPETRKDNQNHSRLMGAPRSPVENYPSSMYEGELKRKRYAEEQGGDPMSRRTRLPSLPGLSIAGTLPPPPGFASSHRGASRSPLPSPSHSLYQRDAARTGYRLAGDDGGETDQLDMDVDGVDGADGYQQGGGGKNKEDARKEKNRDKQRRLRMRRANQLQTLESTVSTQESDIKRLSHQVHEADDRLRHTNSVFFDWIDALETRLRTLGEPDSAIISLRDQHMGSLNASLRDSQRDSTYRESSKSTTSGHRLQYVKGTSIDDHAPHHSGHMSRQPHRADNLVVSRLPYESRSPASTSPYRAEMRERNSSPPYMQQRREQTQPHDAHHVSIAGRDLLPSADTLPRDNDDPWRKVDRSDMQQAARHPAHSVDLDRKYPQGESRMSSDGHRDVKDSNLEQEILARLEVQEVFDMPDTQVTQLASTLVRQKQSSSLREHRKLSGGDDTDHAHHSRPDSITALPWRDRYTAAQVLLLYRSVVIMTSDDRNLRDRHLKQRSSMLSPADQETWEAWTRTPDKDKRIELLQDPILQTYFIGSERSSTAIEAELIPFLCDQLHEARLFGPAWSIECWEMTTSFEDRWTGFWPKNLATASLADWRRKDGHTGASPLEVIMGLDSHSHPHSTLKRGYDLSALP